MSDTVENQILQRDHELERSSSSVSQKIHYSHDQKKFIKIFPELIQEAQTLGTVCSCNLERDVLWQGKIYPTAYHICFYGKIFAKAAKVTIHFKDITQIEKRSTVGMFPNAIRINTANIEYVFSSFLKRDVTYQAFCDAWHRIKSTNEIQNENLNNQGIDSQEPTTDRNLNKHKKTNSLDQINAYAQDESKKTIIEEDVTMLSQSYPDQSPIENAYYNNHSEFELSNNENLFNNPQISAQNMQNKMIDNTYNVDSKGLYQLLFEDNTKFLFDVYKNSNNDNIKIGLWKKDPRTNLKERIIMYNSLNKALFSSRGSILTEEKQKILKNDNDNYFIESEVRVLNINYGEYFRILCKYFIISEKEDISRLLVTFEIKFIKKLALSDKIEKTMFDNYTSIFTELENQLNKTINKNSNKNTNNEAKDSNYPDEGNLYNEPISEKGNPEVGDSSLETLNDKKEKFEDAIGPSTDEKEDSEYDKSKISNSIFNTKIFRTPFFNYMLDGVFLIVSILIHIPSILISVTNFLISLFRPQDQKHSKKKSKDVKKVLSSAPYLFVVLGVLLVFGVIITFCNAYYAHQLRDLENVLKRKQTNTIDPSIITKLQEFSFSSGDQDVIEALVGSSYERYNDILKEYNKQKEKHSEDFNFSYLRLNQQFELINKKFDEMKVDIDNIMKEFSAEGLVKLINELEQNKKKDK